MTQESSQTVTIRIPIEFDKPTRLLIAEDIVEFIRNRTSRGLDKNNKPFTPYSKSYVDSIDFKNAGKRKNRVNLELSGDMMTELQVLNVEAAGFVVIGYPLGEENNRAAWQRNNLQPGFPKRDFLGIAQKDLKKIIDKYRPLLLREAQEERDRRERIAEEARRILSRINFGD